MSWSERKANALPLNTILTGDALTTLESLPAGSVDCVVTSPPYFQLRNYGTAGQLGMEQTVDDWVANLRQVCGAAAQVLVPSGALWLNLGDSFSRHPRYGAPAKGLLLAPERLLLALADDGWLVRTKVIWHKPNAMPTSVNDRLKLSYEVIYFLVRRRRYFFDLEAIKEPVRSMKVRRMGTPGVGRPQWVGPLAASRPGLRPVRESDAVARTSKTPDDVWSIATRGARGLEHPAMFPPELVRRPILATCPIEVCTNCGRGRKASEQTMPCKCDASTRPGRVLDPFCGSGTTALVAQELGRDFVGIEINADYVRLAEQRLGLDQVPDVEVAA